MNNFGCSSFLSNRDFSNGSSDPDDKLINRFYHESVAFMRELEKRGHDAATEWCATASFEDMLYVKALMHGPHKLESDPVIGHAISSAINGVRVLARLNSIRIHREYDGAKEDYVDYYTNIFASAWCEAFHAKWDMCQREILDMAQKDFLGLDVSCFECRLQNSSCPNPEELAKFKNENAGSKGKKPKAPAASA